MGSTQYVKAIDIQISNIRLHLDMQYVKAEHKYNKTTPIVSQQKTKLQ
jgi:hypothetical protein